MQIFRLARHPTHAVRSAIVALLLALGLNAFAHAGHSHESAGGGATATLHSGCGYCATFTGFADAPRIESFAPIAPYRVPRSAARQNAAPIYGVVTSASPRGPPRA